MKLRVARHTNDLKTIVDFYADVLGLSKTGGFKNHSNYNGAFLSLPEMTWELEFTVSEDAPKHQSDEDDLLIFYVTKVNFDKISKKLSEKRIETLKPKNPYWDSSLHFKDPDGFGIIIALEKT